MGTLSTKKRLIHMVQVLRTETKKSKKQWGTVLFEDGRFSMCLDPKSRGVGWAKLRVL